MKTSIRIVAPALIALALTVPETRAQPRRHATYRPPSGSISRHVSRPTTFRSGGITGSHSYRPARYYHSAPSVSYHRTYSAPRVSYRYPTRSGYHHYPSYRRYYSYPSYSYRHRYYPSYSYGYSYYPSYSYGYSYYPSYYYPSYYSYYTYPSYSTYPSYYTYPTTYYSPYPIYTTYPTYRTYRYPRYYGRSCGYVGYHGSRWGAGFSFSLFR